MECCICFELYDTRQHVPLVLQCGHTMCAACVAALPQPRMCPLDRQPEPRQLSAIPHNFALEEAAAAAQGQPKVQKAAQPGGSKANASSSSGGSGKGDRFDPSHLQASPRMLGKSSGGIASVVEGTYKGRKVAIKVIDLLCMPQPARQALFKGLTAMVQAAAGCTAVCCFEGLCMRGEQLLLVMKQYSSSLSDVLSKQTGVDMQLPQLLQHCCQILTLLSSLHSKGLVAGDLKPSNLLLIDRNNQQPQQQQQQQQQQPPGGCSSGGYSCDQQMVVSDSQLHVVMSQALGELWPTEAAMSEPWYKAPEYYLPRPSTPSSSRCSAASDMWAFACVALHMATGKPPLSHMSPQRALAFLGVQKCMPLDTPTTTLPKGLPGALQQLLCACLQPDPVERPTAAEALQVVQQLMQPPAALLMAQPPSTARLQNDDAVPDPTIGVPASEREAAKSIGMGAPIVSSTGLPSGASATCSNTEPSAAVTDEHVGGAAGRAASTITSSSSGSGADAEEAPAASISLLLQQLQDQQDTVVVEAAQQLAQALEECRDMQHLTAAAAQLIGLLTCRIAGPKREASFGLQVATAAALSKLANAHPSAAAAAPSIVQQLMAIVAADYTAVPAAVHEYAIGALAAIVAADANAAAQLGRTQGAVDCIMQLLFYGISERVWHSCAVLLTHLPGVQISSSRAVEQLGFMLSSTHNEALQVAAATAACNLVKTSTANAKAFAEDVHCYDMLTKVASSGPVAAQAAARDAATVLAPLVDSKAASSSTPWSYST